MTLRFTALLVILVAAPLGAQSTPTPEAAATALSSALANQDWPGAARLMHPAALRQLRELFALALTNEKLGEARTRLFGFGSVAEASAAPDTVLFAKLIEKLLTQQPGVIAALKSATSTPMGHVQVSDTAFVLVRMVLKSGPVPVTQFDVMPFVKDGQNWKGGLKADFTNLAGMLKSLVAPVGG